MFATTLPADEIHVTATPVSLGGVSAAYGIQTLTDEDLNESPELRLDEKLATLPAFSLFRRSGSQISHPTSQGVTLRSIGPNGAGRTLVLLDGVPQGDPFGGWVNWARLPLIDIETIDIVKGGGTGPWGNGALAGVILMNTRTPEEPETRFEGSYGSFNTVDVTGSTFVGQNGNGISLSANYYNSDGAYIVDKAQRGAADTRASGEGGWMRLKATTALGDRYRVSFTGGFSDEDNLNGTAYTGNGTRVWEGAVGLERIAEAGEWAAEANIYVRDQSFYSRFSGVSDDRQTETPALDQYDVPATAKGANLALRKQLTESFLFEMGGDIRRTKGATNEQYFYSGGEFIRDRSAGGVQTLGGIFTEAAITVTPKLDVSVGLRLDYWKNSGGYRREADLTINDLILDETYVGDSDVLPGGRAAFNWHMTDSISSFGSVYSGVRAPSLNELYRPFRVGSDITEANASLDIEKLYGAELGMQYQSKDGLQAKVTYFRNWLNDGVGNITLASTGGFYAPLGIFVPAGGSLSQRRNVDRVIVDGIEVDISIPVTEAVTLDTAYFWNNARISKNADDQGLVGNRLAQTAQHSGYLAIRWTPADAWLVRVSADIASKQYDDDQNSRVLPGYVTADVFISYALSTDMRVYVAGQNIFDKKVLTGLRSNGLQSIAEPANFRVGIKSVF
ncbi:TonB-dependent receptor [Kordiimonas pumila]|uniref:TonB-dependent receptor n=1 Tax=Kordiimonas pumila TaxID=2161677 RepID=A0ABV7DA85_9PROT|nr:TonB-dependent receptor [Kordiimonas pumila]